ncbi:FIG00452399: hypothetical protein [Candidatus Paraburkholderia kirkii UZHbot1]|uniref:DUF2288 domain-containing protein n=1 Tax=Candidatus Paraburkholderia kirkii UZHbot1 TaxID=1055526 RepID=G4MDD6_9BURK|nr:FIG00452399: hypothetical protein [Candidatus Paraburkholderia kirkii UZHbot1]
MSNDFRFFRFLPMSDAPTPSPLYVKLLGETAQIGWSELERFFAKGVLIWVKSDLDLVSVAEAVANDDKQQVTQWLSAGLIERMQAETAADLAVRDPELRAVVLSPWVCVQERGRGGGHVGQRARQTSAAEMAAWARATRRWRQRLCEPESADP